MPPKIPTPPDPRNLLPSRAEPEQREKRKKLEKEHAVGLKEVAVLGLIGLTLAWDIEKQVEKREQKKEKDKMEEDERERDRHRNRRSQSHRRRDRDRDRDHDYDYDHARSGRRSERSATRDHETRRYQSVDHRDSGGNARHRGPARSRERLPPPPQRYGARGERGYDEGSARVYHEPRYDAYYEDSAGHGRRSRRDSW